MSCWIRGPIIGRGSSSDVAIAVSDWSGEVLAVKYAGMSLSESLQKEQAILSTISSPHIVSYKGWDVTTEGDQLVYNLFMEYCPYGTLRDAIKRCGGRLSERDIGMYTRDILVGLEYLHERGIVHCDVKPRNVLITDDGAKISDFGCAKQVDEVGTISGTPMFMAPEVARGEGQGLMADVWAVGCTVIEMASGKAPWSESGDPFSIMRRIAYSSDLPEIPSGLSDEAKDFLSKCLMRDPKERGSVAQLLKHPFLAQHSSPVSKQTEEPNSSSPTGVLDHEFWSSSMEYSDPESAFLEHTILGSYATDRIKQLTLSHGQPDWTLDEDWTTVRAKSDEMEEQTTSRTLSGSDTVTAGDINVPRLSGFFDEPMIPEDLPELGTMNACNSLSCTNYSLSIYRTGQDKTNLIISNTKLMLLG